MAIIPIMIWSCELIPEVLGFENQESAEEAFREAYPDIFSVPIERGEEIPSLEDALQEGFMSHHDHEIRMEAVSIPGALIPSNQLLPLLKLLDYSTPQALLVTDEIRSLRRNIGISYLEARAKHSELWPRQCSVTGRGMMEGWVWGEGAFYTKYRWDTLKELQKDYPNKWKTLATFSATPEDDILEWAHNEDILYWTQWEWDESEVLQQVISSGSEIDYFGEINCEECSGLIDATKEAKERFGPDGPEQGLCDCEGEWEL